jgi:hypothetical protein
MSEEMDDLIERLESAKVGERVAVPKDLHLLTFDFLFRRGEAHKHCDRFELTPPHGYGFTGNMWYLFGYRGDDCLLVSALPINPIAALINKETDNE